MESRIVRISTLPLVLFNTRVRQKLDLFWDLIPADTQARGDFDGIRDAHPGGEPS
jgi:hypothetical protein